MAQVAGDDIPGWTLTVGDVREVITETEIDRLILDMVDPWSCIPLAVERLVPGGIICAYVATTTQLSRFVETIREDGGFTEPRAWETLERDWHLEGLAVRPAAQDERAHRVPGDGASHGAGLPVDGHVAPARPGRLRARLHRPAAVRPEQIEPV